MKIAAGNEDRNKTGCREDIASHLTIQWGQSPFNQSQEGTQSFSQSFLTPIHLDLPQQPPIHPHVLHSSGSPQRISLQINICASSNICKLLSLQYFLCPFILGSRVDMRCLMNAKWY